MAYIQHRHPVYDTDLHYVIDPITRQIKSECGKVQFMQYDHNSERITFAIPRYVDGHDMSLCNASEVHYINTSKSDKTVFNAEVYPIVDLQIHPDDDQVVIGSWLVSQNATKYCGSLAFIVRFACIEDTEITYQWHTDIYKDIKIVSGIYNTSVVTQDDDRDVLAAWKKEVFDIVDPMVKDAQDAAESAANSAENAKVEAANAEASANRAATSEANAKQSEYNAKTSENEAKQSEINAKTSENAAKQSEINAKTSETNAKQSEEAAKQALTEVEEASEQAIEDIEDAAEQAIKDIEEVNAEVIAEVDEIVTKAAFEAAAIVDQTAANTQEIVDRAIANVSDIYERTAVNIAEFTEQAIVNVNTINDRALANADDIIEDALDVAEKLKDETKQAVMDAQSEVTNAKLHADASANSAEESAEYSELSKSWAVGDTGVRIGENTNNSKYYSEAAHSIHSESLNALDDAKEMLAEATKVHTNVEFSLDFETGELVYNNNSQFIFGVNTETGNLEWEVA